MFELTEKENEVLRSQNATLNRGAHGKNIYHLFLANMVFCSYPVS